MQFTKNKLKKIIQEELDSLLKEQPTWGTPGDVQMEAEPTAAEELAHMSLPGRGVPQQTLMAPADWIKEFPTATYEDFISTYPDPGITPAGFESMRPGRSSWHEKTPDWKAYPGRSSLAPPGSLRAPYQFPMEWSNLDQYWPMGGPGDWPGTGGLYEGLLEKIMQEELEDLLRS